MIAIFFLIILAYLIIDTFVFRYQRTTLAISRKLTGTSNSKVQAMLTPTWLGALGLVRIILVVGLTVWAYFLYNWIWSAGIIAYNFLGSTIVDIISPLPTQKYCFQIIKKSLTKDIYYRVDNSKKIEMLQLLTEVQRIEKEILPS